MSKLKCFNPFCPRKQSYFKNQKGLELHLLNNKSCLFHLINDSNNINLAKYNLTLTDIDTNYHVNKRLCTDSNNTMYQNSHALQPATNYFTDDMQYMLDDANALNDDDNSHDSTYSAGSVTSLSDKENLDQWFETENNDNELVLGNIYTLEQRCMINLMKILEDMNCPDTALTKIIDWARAAYNKSFDFNPASKTRHGNIQWMKKMTVNNSAFFPKLETVHLNDVTKIDIVCYDFTTQLLRLLQKKVDETRKFID